MCSEDFTLPTKRLISSPSGCYAIPEEYIHWNDSPALLVIAVASVGIATTCVVTLIFIQHNSTPVVKSSTRELSYIILVGMAMSHGTSLAFLFKVSCYKTHFGTRVLELNLFGVGPRTSPAWIGMQLTFIKRSPML